MWELSASQSENFRVFVTPFTLSKGQIISKRLLVSSDSSKKRTNKFGFLQCWTEVRRSTAVAEDLRPTATATVAEV